MKSAQDCTRTIQLVGLALAAFGIGLACPARAQQDVDQRFQIPPPAPRATAPDPQMANVKKSMDLRDVKVPGVRPARIPVNPTDAIAIVNGQEISRQQLADECVAREGKKILEALINRTLIEQALRRQKLEITGAEIDEEIDNVAQRFGLDREKWLLTLDRERNISPAQYAREIIFPALALRKLCSGKVQVTPQDLQDAFEAQYGEKLRCRMILVNTQIKAMGIWEELQKNPGGFVKMAETQSMDNGSKAMGGLLTEPITRHAYPKNVSDSAFQQLVDGDPNDRDPSHKPKDGDITGPIQVGETGWVILRREELVPANKTISLKDERVRKQTYELIYQVKLKEAMEKVFQDLVKSAAFENRLTGQIKEANEEKLSGYAVDRDVKLMGNRDNGTGSSPSPRSGAVPGGGSSVKLPTPAALPAAVQAQQFRPLKPGGNPPQ